MADSDLARNHHHQGHLQAALPIYARAIAQQPSDPRLRHDYAVCLMQSARFADAVPQLEAALAMAPDQADSLTVLALCLRAANAHDRALAAARQATMINPSDAIAWMIIGSSEIRLGNAKAAESSLRRAIALEPANMQAWHSLGECLQMQRRWPEAAHAYRQALPSHPGEIANIALCAEQAGALAEARAGYQSACEKYPRRADYLLRLAHIESMMCLFDSASRTSARLDVLLQSPDALSEDDVPEAFPLSYLDLSQSSVLNALARYRQRIEKRVAALSLPSSTPAKDKHRIRIGYISPDFGAHAVGRLVRDLFSAHDRMRFEVFGYDLYPHHDEIGHHIRASLDGYCDCSSLASIDIATRIREDAIDILIDLGGYTRGARPEVLAMRPAPMQLAWLGFIHGMDVPWLDGNLLDSYLAPASTDWPFQEPLLRLPGTIFPASPSSPGQPDRNRFGLQEDRFLFASFNNSYKLDRELLRAWLQILRRTANADLVIYLPKHARDGFLSAWSDLGGQREHLIVVDALPFDEQRDRAASCDLFLDAFRYQAGATGMSSICAGLPILCREGNTPLSRLSVSLNGFLGLDELICGDTHTYIEQAVHLASSQTALAGIRSRMKDALEDRHLTDPNRALIALNAIIDNKSW